MKKFRSKSTRELYQHANDLNLDVTLTANGHLRVVNPKTKQVLVCSSKIETGHVYKRQISALKALAEGRMDPAHQSLR